MKHEPIRWRWALYGLTVGAVVCVVAFVLDARGYEFASGLRPGIVRSAGFSATLLVFGVIGFVAGLVRDRMRSS